MTVNRQQKRVNMVRHDDVSIEQVSVTLEMLQFASHDSAGDLLEETRSMPLIEPLFAGFLEATNVFMLSLRTSHGCG